MMYTYTQRNNTREQICKCSTCEERSQWGEKRFDPIKPPTACHDDVYTHSGKPKKKTKKTRDKHLSLHIPVFCTCLRNSYDLLSKWPCKEMYIFAIANHADIAVCLQTPGAQYSYYAHWFYILTCDVQQDSSWARNRVSSKAIKIVIDEWEIDMRTVYRIEYTPTLSGQSNINN